MAGLLARIFSYPLRVYAAFLLLIALGLWCYLQLPVALFPNSSKPLIWVNVPYGMLPWEAFLHRYGTALESDLRHLHNEWCTPERVKSSYEGETLHLKIDFHWGDDATICLKEVNQVLANHKASWPDDIRSGAYAWINQGNTGFLFGSFHSSTRSAQEVFDALYGVLQPKLTQIEEAHKPSLYNPDEKQIVIALKPLEMAAYRLLPRDVYEEVKKALKNFGAGTQRSGYAVEVGNKEVGIATLAAIPFGRDQHILLAEIADIKEAVTADNQQLLKINGQSAVGLHVVPAPGRNIKAMSDKVLAAVKETLESGSVPSDISFALTIDPSQVISAATNNVLKEVWLCSLIAVIVLFIFIGSIAGTFTALMEIPTSILLSFILMKLTGVELNLISLGGLALSVGMNVDASIVVIDQLSKKLSGADLSHKSLPQLAALVSAAVGEVAMPVFIATCTSLLVFVPLVFTSDLTYALLGDLAKAVIYSHGISLVIALLLVPTIRVHLASRGVSFADTHAVPLVGRALQGIYRAYAVSVSYFIARGKLVALSLLVVTFAIVAASFFIPSQLKQEIIGQPDTMIIGAWVEGKNLTHMRQMEDKVAEFEREIKERFPDKLAFTFSQFNSLEGAFVALQLKQKSDYRQLFADLEDLYKGRLDLQVSLFPWNPSELPIPNPPDWRVDISALNDKATVEAMESLRVGLRNSGVVDDIALNVPSEATKKLLLVPYPEIMGAIKKAGYALEASDLADIVNLSHRSVEIARIPIGDRVKLISAIYPQREVDTVEEISGVPVAVGERIVPLEALASAEMVEVSGGYERINGEKAFYIQGRLSEKEKLKESALMASLKAEVEKFAATMPGVRVSWVNPKVELDTALHELVVAIAISLLLIFLVLLLQFGEAVHVLIVMLAIPFGFLGVLLSLWLFGSSLSLNSALGLILLNGITVANSILLVEMILRLVRHGKSPEEAIALTARARIRPILMTSLITIFGMLPLALGYGEGGRVLQPLGIAVCGGLWVSLVFTLYLIPALELWYLRRRKA
jgi:multidrug efflux pump subunit AcrB